MEDVNLAPVCGIYCGACEYLNERCRGCGHEKGKPFWTSQVKLDVCPLYDCCVNRKHLEHCGLCNELPCDTFNQFHDPALSAEEARQSIIDRWNDLLRRKEIGTQRWLEEKRAAAD